MIAIDVYTPLDIKASTAASAFEKLPLPLMRALDSSEKPSILIWTDEMYLDRAVILSDDSCVPFVSILTSSPIS